MVSTDWSSSFRASVTLVDCVQLANVLSSEALFYTCIIPFIIFFGCFAAFMYPLRETLHPTGTLLSRPYWSLSILS